MAAKTSAQISYGLTGRVDKKMLLSMIRRTLTDPLNILGVMWRLLKSNLNHVRVIAVVLTKILKEVGKNPQIQQANKDTFLVFLSILESGRIAPMIELLKSGYPKNDYVVDQLETMRETTLFAQRRASELADEFTKLEVQIAAVLLALTGFFADKMSTEPTIYTLDIQRLYFLVVLTLTVSLVCGLYHIKKKEWWWDEHCEKRLARKKAWNEAILGNKTFEEALSFNEGVGKGNEVIVYAPKIGWILQTISLGCGVFALALLFLAIYV